MQEMDVSGEYSRVLQDCMPDMCEVEKVKYKAQEERLPLEGCRCDHRGHVGLKGWRGPVLCFWQQGF